MSPVRLRVRDLRLTRGWTQAELAKRANVRRATINRIENGRTTGVDFDVLERIADAFGLAARSLIVQDGKRTLRQGRH